MAELCKECIDLKEHSNTDKALCCVVETGHIHCMRKLLENAADVNGSNTKGDTPLTLAAKNGHIAILTELIKSGADVNAHDIEGCTATLWASLKGFTECINVLSIAGADVNMKNNLGESPLGWAAQNGHSSCINALINQGADVNITTENHSLWAFINKPFMDNTALILAIEEGHDECVDILIAAGADVNKPNGSGEGPLMIASRNGSDKYVEKLITAGADVNKRSDCAYTPLMAAITRKMPFSFIENVNEFLTPHRTNCIKLLIDAGADVNTKTIYGDPIIVKVLMEGNYDHLELLVKAGADVNVVDIHCSTPMNSALRSFNSVGYVLKYAKLFLRAGVKMNITRYRHNLYMSVRDRHFQHPRKYRKLFKILFAAGEAVEPYQMQCRHGGIPDNLCFLQHDDLNLSLMHLCREMIRKHLMQMSQVNLFFRVPQLEIPLILHDYLLYEQTLDGDEDDDEDDDDSDEDDDDDDENYDDDGDSEEEDDDNDESGEDDYDDGEDEDNDCDSDDDDGLEELK